ncbi:MAG: FtsX-like permease family protein [Desulfopila sp.]|jgi:putative ABC transport system permease protein|nr:FtsX-like permease family protein [Desulfopila sp.]
MNILTIPFGNIRRKLTKTSLLILVFSLGVMSIVALHQISLVVGESLERKLNAYGANIVVSPHTESLSVSYGGFHMGDMLYSVDELQESTAVKAIRAIELQERISVVAPKLISTISIDDTPVAVVGVRWEEEIDIKSYWAIDGDLPKTAHQVLLGKDAAAALGVVSGGNIEILRSTYQVSGTLAKTGGNDDRVIFMELSALQKILNKPDSVSFIEIAALCHGCPIDDIVSQIQSSLPRADIKALQSIVSQRMESVHFVQNLALFVSLIILLTAAVMVALSMLSAVNERKKDIGILRSLGYAKHQIFIIFCVEAGLIGMISGLAGYLAGYGISFEALELLGLSENFQPIFNLFHLFVATILFGVITVVAALYPAWKGAVIEPSEALVAL